MFVGTLLLVARLLRFVPGAGDIILSILNVTSRFARVNIAIGLVGLGMALRGHVKNRA